MTFTKVRPIVRVKMVSNAIWGGFLVWMTNLKSQRSFYIWNMLILTRQSTLNGWFRIAMWINGFADELKS